MKKYNTIGKKNVRRALRKTMPKAEVILWNLIRNKKILGLRFLRQYGVENYIIDFYCPKIRLAIEIDGADHTFTINAVNKDFARQKEIEELGIIFLRFTNEEIYKGIDEVIEEITETGKKLLKEE